MDKLRIAHLRSVFQTELTQSVLPFWEKYGVDRVYGGFLTHVDRNGSLYSTDKSGWFQGRGTWTFSKAYNEIEARPEWLDIAASGYAFLNEHCFDRDGRMFFELTRDGQPLRKRRYWFAEAFAVSAMAEYYKACKDPRVLSQAQSLFDRIVSYYEHPEQLPAKYVAENFKVKAHNTRMVLLATAQILREAAPDPRCDQMMDAVIQDLFRDFVKPEREALLECVAPDGSYIDTPLGRRVNPGHSMETAWFLLEEAERRGDRALVDKTTPIIRWSMNRGWDRQIGGLYNYVDLEGRPSDKVEWDMKYWWTHAEALVANLYAYYLTGESEFERNFDRVLDYTWSHFPDPECGEWFGYLHRDGSRCLDAKGTLFKGPFHIPRALIYCIGLLDKLEKRAEPGKELSP